MVGTDGNLAQPWFMGQALLTIRWSSWVSSGARCLNSDRGKGAKKREVSCQDLGKYVKDDEVTWVVFSKDDKTLRLDKQFAPKHMMSRHIWRRAHLSVVAGDVAQALKGAGVQPSLCTYRTGSPVQGTWLDISFLACEMRVMVFTLKGW